MTFPIDIPEIRGRTPVAKCSFKPAYNQMTAPTRGGLIQVVNLGPDLWTMEFQTAPLSPANADIFEAWLQSLRGGARLFKAWNPTRRRPAAYLNGWAGLTRVGGGAFDGTAHVDAIGETRDTVTIDTLPEGFQLKIGDMLSFPIGASSQTLHRVMANATADGTGELEALIEPIVPLSAVADVACTFEKPWCLAVLDANSVSVARGTDPSPISFNAWQTF